MTSITDKLRELNLSPIITSHNSLLVKIGDSQYKVNPHHQGHDGEVGEILYTVDKIEGDDLDAMTFAGNEEEVADFLMKKKSLNESELRSEVEKYVKEYLMSKQFSEYHELVDDDFEWEKEKETVMRIADRILMLIEEDEYKSAIREINRMIMKLGTWKAKLSKTL